MERAASCEGFGLDLHHVPLRDYRLILAAQQGDRAAFRELVLTYDAMVMRVALSLTASEPSAQQIYCLVFIYAFASITQVDSTSSVFIWLYRILVRHCLEYCRHNPGPELAASENDPASRMSRALLALPPMERVVFHLKQFQGLKIRTLAEVLNVPTEFITTTLQNAIGRLRTQLRGTPTRAAASYFERSY